MRHILLNHRWDALPPKGLKSTDQPLCTLCKASATPDLGLPKHVIEPGPLDLQSNALPTELSRPVANPDLWLPSQIILLNDRSKCTWTTCPFVLHDSTRDGSEACNLSIMSDTLAIILS